MFSQTSIEDMVRDCKDRESRRSINAPRVKPVYLKAPKQFTETLVDPENYDLFSAYNWRAAKGNYVYRRESRKSEGKAIWMHREILSVPPGIQIDHINGNPLDNRRENLRQATPQQNSQNRRKHKGSSRYKGVTFHKGISKWQASIKVGERSFYLGVFEDEKEAALAYDEAARKNSSFAWLNFPDGAA